MNDAPIGRDSVVTREFDETGERCADSCRTRRADLWRVRQELEHSTPWLRIEITTIARAMSVSRASL